MKYQVRISERAEQDADRVLKWFVNQSADRAGQRWLGQLMDKIATLESTPTRCALAAEAEQLGQEIREMLFGRGGRFRIIFKFDGHTVYVLRIWHSARQRLSEEDL